MSMLRDSHNSFTRSNYTIEDSVEPTGLMMLEKIPIKKFNQGLSIFNNLNVVSFYCATNINSNISMGIRFSVSIKNMAVVGIIQRFNSVIVDEIHSETGENFIYNSSIGPINSVEEVDITHLFSEKKRNQILDTAARHYFQSNQLMYYYNHKLTDMNILNNNRFVS